MLRWLRKTAARSLLMKKLIVPVLIILTLILAACGNGGGSSSGNNNNGGVSQQGLSGGNSYINCPSSPNTTAAAPESGSVTLTVSGWSSSPAEDALVQQNLKNFETAHPNIHINWSPIPGDYPPRCAPTLPVVPFPMCSTCNPPCQASTSVPA